LNDSAELPGAVDSLWRSLKLGYRAEPRLLLVSFGITLLGALPDALFALWLALFADGIRGGDEREIAIAAIGLGGSSAAGWLLRIIGERVQRRFRDKATILIETHVAQLQASTATMELHERPEYLDRLTVLRDQVFALNHLYLSIFGVVGWIVRLGVTVALLMSIHPALGLLAVFALPTVWVSSWRAGVQRVVDERAAPDFRLTRHVFQLATTAPAGKEVRVAGIGEQLREQRDSTWERWYAPVARARWATAWWQALAWALFGGAFVGAVVFVSEGLGSSVGDTLLVLAAGSRLSQYLNATVGEVGFLRGIWLDSSRRLAWLEDYTRASGGSGDVPAPVALKDGIVMEGVSFAYPGTTRLVLEDVNVRLPAGCVVAVVGENGAGKSTLVKLLCRLYDPTAGRITVDGAELARIASGEWRDRVAGAFQDFFKFEFFANQTVGLGDVPRMEERPAVEAAVGRAGAEDVVTRLTYGLDTQLGPAWREGAELSFGQWQKLALARGFMRDHPLLLVLDEPTAALDAETEHALFEGYSAAARTGAIEDGRITVLVSHRFSTVRMADLIVVIDGAHVVEVGSHEALMARKGQYAELYGIQAAAYR
jgi:ATP-binding cassette, subfamily B, bacterial